MRRLRIEHVTGFKYPGEAGASYNEARMLPSSSDNQFVLFTSLDVSPSTSINYYTDYFGSLVAAFDVLTPHPELSITARSLVEARERPIESMGIAWDELRKATAESIGTAEMTALTPLTRPHAEVVELARDIAERAANPDDTALEVIGAVHDAVEYMHGSTGVHSTAIEAWEQRQGVCQDFAHIAIGALREVGIPARYVSGYLHPREDAELFEPVTGESHAWIEWFAGRWQGFDPTNGISIGERHVLVGRGRDYTDVPPLRGIYDGPKGSDLHVSVTITRES